ncbi:MAG TPA: ribosome biogenesis GTPase Der [Bacteroidota bacterium]|nr:ribosome biogenesis GTPase Der [Bacteroidota bacterium]
MSSAVVALVGRPNVGKSTLFNRIIGKRDAIVHDVPGVTRDRHYAQAEWAGKHFAVVDTGGYVPEAEGVIETAIREQAQIAIEEADVVLFVVDAQTGLLPTDFAIADILRRSEKKVILVVNKVDGEKQELTLGEYYRLGLGEPFAVSALVGRKTGDLLDIVTADFVRGTEERTDPRLKIAVIGKPNVGKSSLVNALLQEDRHIVTDIPGTTRDPIDAVLKYYGEEILLIDTAGLRRRSRIQESVEFYSAIRTLKAIERCDVAVVVIDATQGLEHQDLRVLESALERNRPVLLAVNKWDIIEKNDRTAQEFEKALKEKLRAHDYVPIIFISALTRQRIYKVIELAKQIDAEQNKRIATSRLNELLGADVKAFPPRSKSGKEIKIKYVTQVKAKPPVFAFFCNDPTLIDETYRRYLMNRIRHHFSFTGVPITLSFKQK